MQVHTSHIHVCHFNRFGYLVYSVQIKRNLINFQTGCTLKTIGLSFFLKKKRELNGNIECIKSIQIFKMRYKDHVQNKTPSIN